VRGGHERSEKFAISRIQSINGLKHPFILPDHMPGAALGKFRKVSGFELRHIDIPEGFDPHPAGGFEALLAAFVVFATDEGVFHAGVDDEQAEVRGERDVFDRLGAAIEENKVVLEAKHRRGLVEQAAIHADEFVLGASAEFRHLHARERKRVELHQQRCRGDLEGGGTRQPRAGWQGRFKAGRKTSRLGSGAGEHFGDTQRVVDPFSRAVQARRAVDFFHNPRLAAGQLHAPAGQSLASGCDAELERGGEDYTPVVIRVVSEDLDAAWSKSGGGHFRAMFAEGLRLAKRVLCGRIRMKDKTMSDTNDNNIAAKKLESSSDHAKKALDAATEAGRAVGDTVKKHAKAAYETGREHLGAAAKDLGDAASATYGDIREQAKTKAGQLRGRAQSVCTDASARAQDCQTEAETYIRENPLQSVGIALGVGFVLGLILRR
jgi:ElaB/YqjD/DUF883 family membrane-anchored ribosome-binding protein